MLANIFVLCLQTPDHKTDGEIRKFLDAVLQRRLRNVQKSVMHVQSCCFANINLLLYCRSRFRRRRRCLSSLFLITIDQSGEFARGYWGFIKANQILVQLFWHYKLGLTHKQRLRIKVPYKAPSTWYFTSDLFSSNYLIPHFVQVLRLLF